MTRFRNIIIVSAGLLFVTGCATQESPRAVDDIPSSNTGTLTSPEITSSDEDGLSIRYAQVSMGFDTGCNPNHAFSGALNECAKLPDRVKTMASVNCESFGKTAVFLGNRTNILQMTVSKFRCVEPTQ